MVAGRTAEQMKEMGDSMIATLAAPEGKFPNPKVTLTQRQQFFQRLRLDFDELHTCFDTLSDFPALSRMPWPRSSSLTASKVILFWREAQLNECYIYHLRLLAFLRHLARGYRKDPKQTRLITAIDTLLAALETDFAGLKRVRGQHVHEFRHRHLDAEIDRLVLLELLVRGGTPPVMKKLHQAAVRAAKANNLKRFHGFNRRMRRELNSIFQILCLYIVSTEGRLIFPSQLKNA